MNDENKNNPTRWKWDVFGDTQLMVVEAELDVTLWRRLLTRVLLGSRWTRITPKKPL